MADIAPLGSTIAKIASERPPETGVLLRFLLQDESQRLLPSEKVFQCLKRLAPVNQRMGEKSPVYDHVEVHYNSEQNHASYRNLILCDRVWICPVCASRISEFRRRALSQAIDTSRLFSFMTTFTLQHNNRIPLETVLDTLLAAYRKLKSGRWFQQYKHEYSWVGDIRALEITYGANGWHPHLHVLTLIDRFWGKCAMATLENALKVRFGEVLRASGGYATFKNGVTVTDDNQYIRDYISKFGKMPEKEHKKGWTIEHELTGANRKTSRQKDGATPWALLWLSAQGDEDASENFKEYAVATKGRNQLIWSRGLRERLGMAVFETALQDQENQAIALLTIDKYWWTAICQKHLRGAVLAKCAELHGDFEAVERWLIEELKGM